MMSTLVRLILRLPYRNDTPLGIRLDAQRTIDRFCIEIIVRRKPRMPILPPGTSPKADIRSRHATDRGRLHH